MLTEKFLSIRNVTRIFRCLIIGDDLVKSLDVRLILRHDRQFAIKKSAIMARAYPKSAKNHSAVLAGVLGIVLATRKPPIGKRAGGRADVLRAERKSEPCERNSPPRSTRPYIFVTLGSGCSLSSAHAFS